MVDANDHKPKALILIHTCCGAWDEIQHHMIGNVVCQLSCITADKIPNQGQKTFSIFHVQTLKVDGTEGASGKANSSVQHL
jgi:hypothetical protein